MAGARVASDSFVAKERKLPKKRNPLLAPDQTPEHSELASKRRLGATELAVKPGLVGLSSATQPQNLGHFEYLHIRAPLPENLKHSEIFAPTPKLPHPGSYFLMRRSSDGYVSATGMFKASFPWAKHSEEQAEREYLKSLSSTSQDETAGNVWIPESFALELADEYGIVPWIKALLDESPVDLVEGSKSPMEIPPKFNFTAGDKTSLPPPGATPSRRGRPRAGSPSKIATPGKALASPRKARVSKAAKEANAIASRQASESLHAALDSAASIAETESMDGEKAIVEVETTVEVNGDIETTHTNVKVELPAGSPEFPLPESTEDIIAKAKEMVAEARKLDGESSTSASKRKAEELDEDDEDESKDDQLQPAKKARLLQQDLKKQRVRNRALFGVAATLAIGALIPYVIGG